MYLLFLLKIIADLAFFFSFANLAAVGLMGLPREMLWLAMPVFAVTALLSAVICHKATRKWLRFVPLALLGINFIWVVNDILALPVLVLPTFYVIYSVLLLDRYHGGVFYGQIFLYFLRTYLPFSFLAIMVQVIRTDWVAYSLPFAFLFFTTAIVLMRLARHDAQVHMQWRFRARNLLSLGLVVVVGLAAGSQWFMAGLRWLFNTVVRDGLYPAFLFFADYFITFLNFILSFLPAIREAELRVEPEEQEIYGETFIQEMPYGDNNTFLHFFIFLLASLAIILFVALIKRMLNTSFNEDARKGKHEMLLPDAVKNKRKDRVRDPMRKIYRRFLQRCFRSGMMELKFRTSKDYEKEATGRWRLEDEAEQLRALYLPTRYGGATPTREDVAAAKELYRKIRGKSR